MAGLLATLTIASFFCATLFSELLGTPGTIALIKAFIVIPGLFILIPAIALTGASGFVLSKSRQGRVIAAKKNRMPFIVATGVVDPCPMCDLSESVGGGGHIRYDVRSGAGIGTLGRCYLGLMGLNIRDGLSMSGRLRKS
ncbi:hypothetical protein [Propionivibrio sp.]|uniref:hypothetical protein n=1 Tax=Propionivibrio sp. TaxID=2212460 RepID=UPI003BF616D6